MSFWAGVNALVTGGFGFIGSHMVENLVAQGATVTVADDFRTGNPRWLQNLSGAINVLECDVLSKEFLDHIKVSHFDYIFHLASTAKVIDTVIDPLGDCENSLIGSLQILEYLRKESKETAFIFPSSAAVYGNPTKLPIAEDDPTVPISPYGVSKLSVERYLSVYHGLYKIRGCSLRCFSTYGPRQRKLAVYEFINRLLENPDELKLFGDGQQKRDFLYISDVVDAFLLVAQKSNLNGETYNVASGQSVTIAEIAALVADELSVHPRFVFDDSLPSDPNVWIASIDNIRKLGFSPKVDLRTGIRKLIHWVHANQEN